VAVTLKDVARDCGLAVSTVSNILNNNRSSFASEAVRLQVRESAARLGYRKDYLSSSLRTRKTLSIGLILDQINDLTRQEFLTPFVERFSARGYEVAVAEHRLDPDRACAALRGFTDRCKDAVVLFSDLLGRTEAEQQGLRQAVAESGLKVLAVGSALRGQVPSLDIDRGRSVERSLDLLGASPERRVLVVYEYDWDMRPRFTGWDRPGVVYWAGVHRPEDFAARLDAEGLEGISAVFFRTDRIAIPALHLLQARGRTIPGDLEVIGFDNFPFSQHSHPALTTWDIGFHRLGLRSFELLDQWLSGRPPAADHFELFEPEFVPRASHRGQESP